MRHLKFRLFEFGLMQYFDLDDVFYNTVQPSNGVYDTHIMQSSGLKDKNGKEIYEGDIAVGEHASYSIFWDSRMAQFKAKVIKTASVLIKGNSFPLWQYVDDNGNCRIEVVGNIYENAELITNEHTQST